MKPAPWNSGIMIEQLQAGKSGEENKPKVGDMVEVRFKEATRATNLTIHIKRKCHICIVQVLAVSFKGLTRLL